MAAIERINLDYTHVISYIKETLENVNLLSDLLLKRIILNSGQFSTMMPVLTDQQDKYQFHVGGLACGVHDFANKFILKQMENNNKCLIDCVQQQYKLPFKGEIFDACGIHHKDEIYYYLSPLYITSKLLQDCLRFSNSIWHSVCVLSENELQIPASRELDEHNLQHFLNGTTLVLIGAYDGEGYICWEPQNDCTTKYGE